MTIDTKEIQEFGKELAGIDKLVRQEFSRTMTKSLNILEDAIVQRTPVNQGILRAGTATEQRSMGRKLRGLVVNPVSYAWPVEAGRRPGKMPPVDAIKLWVIRKGIARGKEADSAAFLIARAIGRRGTQGSQMFEEGFDASLPTIIRLVDQMPSNIWKEYT